MKRNFDTVARWHAEFEVPVGYLEKSPFIHGVQSPQWIPETTDNAK